VLTPEGCFAPDLVVRQRLDVTGLVTHVPGEVSSELTTAPPLVDGLLELCSLVRVRL
jgi:hypothetical protein